MTTPEQRIKKDIKDALEARGAFWSAIKGGPHSKPGDPDMVACYKGHYIGIEAKTATGRLSEIQRLRAQQIRDAGGIWVEARSTAPVLEVLDTIDAMETE